MKKTFRFNFHKGDPPGDQGQSWMTEEDWAKHDAYVEKLKLSGEYGKPDYVDVTYDTNDFKEFEIPAEDRGKPMFSNFGMLIPQRDGTFIKIESKPE